MAGTSNSIITHNVLKGTLNSDNVISGLVNTAFNPAYALVTQAGAQIVLFINSNDYKMYAQLKDKSGNLIYTSNIIDLPLETMVVDGRYDSNTKKLILVLDNGNEIEVPLEALINGLVNEDDLIANYYDKDEIDALLNGYWTKIELTQEDIDNWNAKQEYLNQGDGIEISADTILKGNTRQESTTGKNLLNIFNFEMGSMSNGNIMSSPYRINNVNNPIEVKPNTTYCISSILSAQVKGMRCGIHECDENMTFKKDSSWQQLATNPYVFTTENYTKYVKIVFTLSTTSTDVQTNITEDVTSYNNAVDWARGCLFQLEEGNTATSWEKYTGGTPAPNPDYPYPVNVVSGDNTIEVRANSNLRSGEQLYQTMYAYNSSNVSEVTDGTINAIRFNPYYYRPLGGTNEFNVYNNWKENTQYTIRVKAKKLGGVGLYLQALYTDGTNNYAQISGSDTEYTELRFVTSANKTIQRVGFSYGTQGEWLLDKSSWYIGEGVQTEYPEYNGTTYPINLGSMELCKIGDYQDYLYKDNRKWYKYGAIGKTEVNLTGNVGSLPNSNKYNAFVPTNKAQIYGNFCYCNKANYNQDNPQDGQFYQNVPNVVYVGNSTDTLATLKQKYDGSLLYYVLNTPTTTEITDTTLISQLNALTTGFSNNWVKNISQTNADLPFEIEYDNTNLTISASSNLVRNTDYATSQTGGVIKVGNAGININNNGYIYAGTLNYTQYNSADNSTFVGKGTLENVITGKELTNKTYVDAADAVFESELFDDGIISIEDSTEANINNTMNKSQLKIDLKGNTSQESTTGKNLEPSTGNSFSGSGMTIMKNSDGSWTLNGTNNTAETRFHRIADDFILPAGTYTLSNSNSSVSDETAIFYDDNWNFNRTNIATKTFSEAKTIKPYIKWKSGVTLTNFTVYPMIEAGSSATTYEPYTGGSPAPNPDYPYPVNVVTGDNEVKVEGKNLFDISKLNSTNFPNATIGSNTITLTGSNDYHATITGTNLSDIADLTVGETYILTFDTTYTGTNSTKMYLRGAQDYWQRGSNLTITQEMLDDRIAFYGTNDSVISNIMIRKSNISDTSYQPYQSQTYPINLGSMELCKIGDYQDVIKRSSGKNLFDVSTINLNKGIDSSGNLGNNNNLSTSDYIQVQPNTSYYLSNTIGSSYGRCCAYYDESKTFISAETKTGQALINTPITTPNNTKYMRVACARGNENILMVNLGDTALPYEPYGKVWYKYGAIKKSILKPQTITLEANGIRMSNYSVGEPVTTYPQIYCEYFRRANNYQEVVGGLVNSIGLNTSGIVLCNVSGYTTTTEYANLFNNNDIYVYFPLKTPTTTEITDTTLIEQLDNLEKAYSYDTQTNISQTNQDKSFILDINAIADNVNGLKLENENQEYKTNKVIELSSSSTDDEYPSAKCVYDIVGNIEAVLAAMDSGSGV